MDFFLDVSDSVFGLKIGSVYRTIGKMIRSDLPILKLCDGLTTICSSSNSNIEIEPIPDDSVGKYRAEGVEWAI